jgi:Icc-related predicted phosphoesterase
MGDNLRILYAADIHGSERTYRKWLNAVQRVEPDVLVFGGDLMGKILHPIVRRNGHWEADLFGEPARMETEAELRDFQARLHNAGRYEVIVTPEEKAVLDSSEEAVHAAFLEAARKVALDWLALADERLRPSGITAFLMLGNDDFPELASVFGQSEMVVDAEQKVIDLPNGFQLISLGYSNRTPWDTPRELDEPDLATRIEAMAGQVADQSKAIYNFHVPPINTAIDVATDLDQNLAPVIEGGHPKPKSVGSTAVRDALTAHQPILSLHGHIHESPGIAKIGRTTAVNPGSEYADGVLRYAIVNLDPKKGVKSWQLLQG